MLTTTNIHQVDAARIGTMCIRRTTESLFVVQTKHSFQAVPATTCVWFETHSHTKEVNSNTLGFVRSAPARCRVHKGGKNPELNPATAAVEPSGDMETHAHKKGTNKALQSKWDVLTVVLGFYLFVFQECLWACSPLLLLLASPIREQWHGAFNDSLKSELSIDQTDETDTISMP